MYITWAVGFVVVVVFIALASSSNIKQSVFLISYIYSITQQQCPWHALSHGIFTTDSGTKERKRRLRVMTSVCFIRLPVKEQNEQGIHTHIMYYNNYTLHPRTHVDVYLVPTASQSMAWFSGNDKTWGYKTELRRRRPRGAGDSFSSLSTLSNHSATFQSRFTSTGW